jgi:F-type H+-transporting ATPase subunit c
MKKFVPKMAALTLLMLMVLLSLTCAAFAASPETEDAQGEETVAVAVDNTWSKSIGSAVAIGLAAAGGAIGMGLAVAKSVEAISRQPEAEGKIRTTLMLGLVFLETAIIYALLVVILLIFVL